MAAGGRRRARGGGKSSNSSCKRNNNRKNNGKGRGGTRRGSSSGTRGALFVEGGLLSDWSLTPTPFRGKKARVNKKSGSKSGSFDREKASVFVRNGPQKLSGNAIGYPYQYPSVDVQEVSRFESSVLNSNDDNGLDESDPFILVDSKEAPIFAYMDKTPSSRTNDVQFTYDYGSNFVLGETSHRGFGFSDEPEGTPSGVEASSKEVEVEEVPYSDSLSSGHEMNIERMNNAVDFDMDEDALAGEGKSYPKTNSGFLHIGGLKLYTRDISGESMDEGISEIFEPDGIAGFSDSAYSEETSDSGLDIDEDVAEDYFEGIGGSDKIVNIKLFVKQEFDESTDNTFSSCDYDETVEELGGIALQKSSKEFGVMKTYPKQKHIGRGSALAMGDCCLVKDPRTASRRKKYISQLSQSWPSEAWGSTTSKRCPGESLKKKHSKEMIAVKRRERMLRRSVDLEQVNVKLEQIVMDGMDIYSFQPMHPRDCSQVRLLAAIYHLQSVCQGSGKKRIVTVTRTQHTCMPSSSDRIRLEKLIGDDMQDADFSVVDVLNINSIGGDKKRSKKFAQGSGLSPLEQCAQSKTKNNSSSCHRSIRANEYKKKGKKEQYANQPMLFVSSGTMQSQNVETATHISVEMESSSKNKGGGNAASENFGTFELYTKGFGSKMMAKMGFEGGGLGKDGQGMAAPIEVIKRPKSLGLGMEFSKEVDDPVKNTPTKPKSQRLAAFENHTKRFGSKMMAKMGFVEGMGLGKDSQGMINPLVAVKRPKARGLGAEV